MRGLGVLVVGLVLVAGNPRIAAAQDSEAPLPPIVEPGPRPLDSRPMRFLLSTGAVVIGTRIGENAEAIGVQTRAGVTTLRKSDIVAMDYRIDRGRSFDLRAQPVPLARPAPPEPEPLPVAPARRRRPGRGATIAGAIIFSLTYGVSCLGALVAVTVGDDAGFLLALPVAGPILWGVTDRENLGAALVATAGQTLGAALLTHGIMSAHETNDVARPARSWSVVPVVTAEVQGLVVAGRM